MKFIYRCLLTINSIIMLLVVYLIKEKISLQLNISLSTHISYLCYIMLTVLMSGICLWMSKFLGNDIIDGGITDIEAANNSYLPSYLGYFFVALSIDDWSTLFWVGILIIVFSYFSQTLYFNPMFFLFGYKFYNVTVDTGMKFFVISKKNITSIKDLKFTKLKRINNYTFIDKEVT